MLSLDTPIKQLNRVGAALANKLKRLGIATCRDLLLHLPHRYQDFSQVVQVNELKPGQTASITARLQQIASRRSPVRRMVVTEALFSDDQGTVKAVWFNQPYLGKTLKQGENYWLSGKVEERYGVPQLTSPQYERSGAQDTLHTGRLVPLYPTTEGLTQKQLRFLVAQALPLVNQLNDSLPEEVRAAERLLPLTRAVRLAHFPESLDQAIEAKRRLGFDELLLFQLKQAKLRQERAAVPAPAIPFQQEAIKGFVASLPFTLTPDQKQATWEILQDLEQPIAKRRLLEGDVGSGKTVVALIAAYQTALAGYQTVILAPTEVLAAQHFDTISRLLGNHQVSVALLTANQHDLRFDISGKGSKNRESLNGPLSKGAGGSDRRRRSSSEPPDPLPAVRSPKGEGRLGRAENEESKRTSVISHRSLVIKAINAGAAQIIIGTHALLSEKIKFKDIGLLIIDEQHRFGVAQRQELLDRTPERQPSPCLSPTKQGLGQPHLLSMTATPIPRTLALTLYGDLELSVLRSKPAGRQPIATRVISPNQRDQAYQTIRQELAAGQQCFVVCPLIEESDVLGVRSATETHEQLQTVFTDFKLGLLHGKLTGKVKQQLMDDFNQNRIQLLVTTAVIEVGVDVPNATVMVIEGAERFGLAQLHQLRGRVGRSSAASQCLLFATEDHPAILERLRLLEQHQDGFLLAEEDLKRRGHGDLSGTAQTGFPEFRVANLFDYQLLQSAQAWAKQLLQIDPSLSRWPALRSAVEQSLSTAHLE